MLQGDKVNLTTAADVITISTKSMNNKRGVIQVTSNKIYHEQGVEVNNLRQQNLVKPAGNSGLQGSKRIHHKNPWIVWWVYLFLFPFFALVLIKLLQVIKRDQP